jgi:hypothetical protein
MIADNGISYWATNHFKHRHERMDTFTFQVYDYKYVVELALVINQLM